MGSHAGEHDYLNGRCKYCGDSPDGKSCQTGELPHSIKPLSGTCRFCTHELTEDQANAGHNLAISTMKDLIEKIRAEHYYPWAKVSDAEVIADILSRYFKWDIEPLSLMAFSYAEECNAHKLADQLDQFFGTTNGRHGQ